MTRAHILVQALSGRGKTFWTTMGGKPYIIAPEQKCRTIIPLLNADARVLSLDTKEDFDRAILAVQSPKLVEHGYTRIVLDSFSELTELIPAWFGMGFPLQIQDYGTIGNKAMSLVLAMLKSPLPGIVICRSEAKEQGKISRVVPGSLGKSAASLPAKLVLTAETRHDDQLGWVVDTTPDDYTQKAGLPWVPSIFQGSADEFLAAVERGPAGSAAFNVPVNEAPILPQKTVAERVAEAKTALEQIEQPPTPATAPLPACPVVNARVKSHPTAAPAAAGASGQPVPLAAVAPTAKHSEAYDALLADLVQAMSNAGWSSDDQKSTMAGWENLGDDALPRLKNFLTTFKAKPSVGVTLAALPPTSTPGVTHEAENFVDEVAEGHVFVTKDEADYLATLLGPFPVAPFLAYLASVKHVIPAADGSLRLDRILHASYEQTLKPILKSEQRRHGMLAFVKQNFPTTTAV